MINETKEFLLYCELRLDAAAAKWKKGFYGTSKGRVGGWVGGGGGQCASLLTPVVTTCHVHLTSDVCLCLGLCFTFAAQVASTAALVAAQAAQKAPRAARLAAVTANKVRCGHGKAAFVWGAIK